MTIKSFIYVFLIGMAVVESGLAQNVGIRMCSTNGIGPIYTLIMPNNKLLHFCNARKKSPNKMTRTRCIYILCHRLNKHNEGS